MNTTTELNGQLYGLYSLKGTFSEGRLLKAGFSRAAIGKAVSTRGLKLVSEGFYAANRVLANKLKALVEEDLEPGQQVFRYKDGRIQKAQVVRVQGQKISVVNPEEMTVDDADEEEIISDEDVEAMKESFEAWDGSTHQADDVVDVQTTTGYHTGVVGYNAETGRFKTLRGNVHPNQLPPEELQKVKHFMTV